MRLRLWGKPPSKGLQEARRAREQAEVDLEATRAETAKYMRLGRELRDLRESNHFLPAIRTAFRGE